MKIRKLLIFSALLCVVASISNCTVQKRSYRNGYYVSWNKKASPLLKVAKQIEAKKVNAIKSISTETLNIRSIEKQEPLLVSAHRSNHVQVKKIGIKPLKLVNDSCGDKITMRNGDDIMAKILEIGTQVIKYKRCNNLNGPTIVVAIKNVFMIKYVNGTREVFKKPEVVIVENKITDQKKVQQGNFGRIGYNGFAIASLATALLSFTIFLAPIPIVFGLIAINQIHKNPQKYKGEGMAVAGIFLSLAILFLVIMAVFGV